VHRAKDTGFMVILSDVVYPAGDVNDYVNGFYIPYRDYDRPIYAIPGNHDWYDGLDGFMLAFCDAQPLPALGFRAASYRPSELVAGMLWRGSSSPDYRRLGVYRHERARTAPGPPQPGPYWVLRTDELAIVAIDTGVAGELDADQGRWLLDVSERIPEPKILLTGKPIYVDNRYRPGPIEWDERDEHHGVTVDDVVRRFDYVAAIGGDTHNYQRYPVRVHRGPEGARESRTVQYVVSGGGGAYLSGTHRIGKVGVGLGDAPPAVAADPPREADFRCHPSRAQSLVFFARRAGPRLVYAFAAGIVLVTAALLLVFATVPLRGRDEVTVAGTLLTAALAGLLGAALARRIPGPGPLVGVAAAPIAGVVLLVDEGAGRPWAVAALTLAAPLAVAAALVLSYEWHAAVPGAASTFLMAAPATALAVVALGELDTGDAGRAAQALVLGLAALVALMLTERLARWRERVLRLRAELRRAPGARPGAGELLAWDAAVAVPWVALAAVVVAGRPGWVASSMAVVAGAAVVIGWVLPLLIPAARQAPDPLTSGAAATMPSVDRLARTLAGIAALALLVAVVDALGAAWVAQVGLESVAMLAAAAAIAFFAVFAWDMRSPVGTIWLGVVAAAVVAVATGSAFAVVAAGVLAVSMLPMSAIDKRGGVTTLWALRSGELDEDYAEGFIARRLAAEPAPRSGASGRDERVASTIYGRRGAPSRRLVDELSDTNEPPFRKSFLCLGVEPGEGGAPTLAVEAYGVTGWEREGEPPELVDRVEIPLPAPGAGVT
jgi:hypothetical protein